mmetsp:Transcript_27984/g.68391  ORF Transcript_27984/g.68391 Transcript_27984/m.68391 type:complete len:303 (-) Transcript_27984:533-1441(-)
MRASRPSSGGGLRKVCTIEGYHFLRSVLRTVSLWSIWATLYLSSSEARCEPSRRTSRRSWSSYDTHVFWSSRAHELTAKRDLDMMSRARATERPQVAGGMLLPRSIVSPNLNSMRRSTDDSSGVMGTLRRLRSSLLSSTYSEMVCLTLRRYSMFISSSVSLIMPSAMCPGMSGNVSRRAIMHTLSIHCCLMGAITPSSIASRNISYRTCESRSSSLSAVISSSRLSGSTLCREKAKLFSSAASKSSSSSSCSYPCPPLDIVDWSRLPFAGAGAARGTGDEKAEPASLSLSTLLVRLSALGLK